MDKIREALAGKKTYLTAVIAILTAVLGFANGTLNVADTFQVIITSVLGMTIRAGVAKK